MKIFLIAPCSYPWQDAVFFKKAMLLLGHEVETFDYRASPALSIGKAPLLRNNWIYPYVQRAFGVKNKQLIEKASTFKPDLLFVMKGESVLPDTIREIKAKTGAFALNYFQDDPQLFNSVSSRIAPAYDAIITSSIYAVDWYHNMGIKKVHWIGFACDPDLHRRVELTEGEKKKFDSDICFVGTYYPNRAKLLKNLTKYDLKVWGKYWYYPLIGSRLHSCYGGGCVYCEDMIKAFCGAKIVLNIHLPAMKHGGMKSNHRAYECSACATFQLSDRAVGMEEVFREKEEIILYDNEKDLVEKVEYYLDHPRERGEIAHKAQQRAYENYTYRHRLEEIFSFINLK